MRISPINNTNYNTNFNAKIVPTEEWNNYLKYLSEHAFKKEGWFDTIKNKSIIEHFVNAVKANPSDAEISLDIFYRKDELFNARGTIGSQYGKFTDTEPARSDSNVPIENIIRRILNPENRFQMYKLFGADYNIEKAKAQDAWWDEHIYPIWNSIKELFYEETFFPKRGDERLGRDRAWYDELWNKQFRENHPV